jgi:hypothetical protein
MVAIAEGEVEQIASLGLVKLPGKLRTCRASAMSTGSCRRVDAAEPMTPATEESRSTPPAKASPAEHPPVKARDQLRARGRVGSFTRDAQAAAQRQPLDTPAGRGMSSARTSASVTGNFKSACRCGQKPSVHDQGAPAGAARLLDAGHLGSSIARVGIPIGAGSCPSVCAASKSVARDDPVCNGVRFTRLLSEG